MYTVYKFTSPSNKSYIGITSRDIEYRKKEHSLAAANGSKTWFHHAIRKYGFENFTFEIIRADINDKKFLAAAEIFYISFYNTFYKGYNMDRGGRGIGRVIGDETRKRLSDSRKKYIKENYDKICESNRLAVQRTNLELKGKKISQTKQKNKSGNNNVTSKHLLIYDNNDKLVYESHGNFKEFCAEHNLPYIRCCRSYQRNRPMTKEFKGWSVKLINSII